MGNDNIRQYLKYLKRIKEEGIGVDVLRAIALLITKKQFHEMTFYSMISLAVITKI